MAGEAVRRRTRNGEMCGLRCAVSGQAAVGALLFESLPTETLPRPTSQPSQSSVLTCRSYLHQRDADLKALIASGRGAVPLVQLRWQCARCGHRKIDMVVTGKETAKPW